jgi:hypothetical protein
VRILTILLIAFFSTQLQAFTFNNNIKLVFNSDEVTVNVANNCANTGIDATEMLSIVSDAVDIFWNKAPTSRLKLRAGAVQSVSAVFHSGNICLPSTNCEPNPSLAVANGILIACNDNVTNFPSASILGITIPNNIAGSTIKGSLIMINDRASNQFSNKSRSEKVAVIAHEIGHAFGLGHSPVPDSLMFYATVDSRTHLGRDDIDGISYLYPKQQPTGCGTISDINKKRPNFGAGLFIGLFLVLGLETLRKKSTKIYT